MDKEDLRKWLLDTLNQHCGTDSKSPTSVVMRIDGRLFDGSQAIQINFPDKQFVLKIETLLPRKTKWRSRELSRFQD